MCILYSEIDVPILISYHSLSPNNRLILCISSSEAGR